MNASSSLNRSLFLGIIALSLGFHAILLTLFVVFGFLHPVTPVEDTTITMLRLASRGNPKTASTGPQRSGENIKPAANPKPQQNPASNPVAAKPSAPTPVQNTKPTAKPKPQPPLNPDANGPKVVSKPNDKKKPTTQTTQANSAAPAPTNAPSAEDQKIAQALNQVKQDLQTRENGSNGSNTGNSEGSAGGTSGNNNGAAGGNIAAADPVLVQYQTQVKQKIIREWIRANTGVEAEVLRTRVSVRIDAGGKVVSTSFVKKSGNASFDLSTIRAVERASPLPTPPEAIKTEALSEGFVIDFNSRMLGT